MKTGPTGIALIKRFEGCRLVAYQDIVGVWTIGYGDTKNVTPGLRITQQEAEDRLSTRLANEFEPGVLKGLGGSPVTQYQFDAMVSLEWNIGIGKLDNPATSQNEGSGFEGSSVARLHRQGKYQAAADAFLLWDKAGGSVNQALLGRRKAERQVYLEDMTPLAEVLAVSPPIATAIVYAKTDCAKDMQAALQRLGVYKLTVDGDWGPGSRSAYSSFLAQE